MTIIGVLEAHLDMVEQVRDWFCNLMETTPTGRNRLVKIRIKDFLLWERVAQEEGGRVTRLALDNSQTESRTSELRVEIVGGRTLLLRAY